MSDATTTPTADTAPPPMTLEQKKEAARARARAAKEQQAAGIASVAITPLAGTYIRKVAAEQGKDDGVRVKILAGGCSGLEYHIDLLDKGEVPADGERELVSGGVRLIMDLKSSIHVTGSIIDYESTILKRGFKIRNPNATSTCSCGDSFGV